MRKPFNENNSGILEIKPIEEIVPEGIPQKASASFEHKDVFVNKKNKEEIVDYEEDISDVEIDLESITEEPEEKKGVGKRGKDKKPRVKKPPTEKQLAHLAKCREVSKKRREAKKLETQRIKMEIKKRATDNTKKNAISQPPIYNKTANDSKTSVTNEVIKSNHNENNINPHNMSLAPSMEQFIQLMEKYEDYKEKKVKVIKTVSKAQPLPTGRTIDISHKPIAPPHNPLKNEPIEPTNPWDICFKYGGRY